MNDKKTEYEGDFKYLVKFIGILLIALGVVIFSSGILLLLEANRQDPSRISGIIFLFVAAIFAIISILLGVFLIRYKRKVKEITEAA
jgi:hypothetical protein